jgi:hypothetical protein
MQEVCSRWLNQASRSSIFHQLATMCPRCTKVDVGQLFNAEWWQDSLRQNYLSCPHPLSHPSPSVALWLNLAQRFAIWVWFSIQHSVCTLTSRTFAGEPTISSGASSRSGETSRRNVQKRLYKAVWSAFLITAMHCCIVYTFCWNQQTTDGPKLCNKQYKMCIWQGARQPSPPPPLFRSIHWLPIKFRNMY